VPHISFGDRLRIPPPLQRVVVFLLMLLVAAGAFAQSKEPAIQAIDAFESATRDHVLMHRRLERQIGSIEFGTPVAEINRIIHELAAALRAERAGARQGDFFTSALADLLRARISDALLEQRYTADDVRAAGRVDGVDYERVRLQVNDTLPWLLGVALLPCVLDVLPPLPPELQYRIVGDDLLLVDVHASLVLDILPRALIGLTVRDVRPQEAVR
jgi:hypothetical protein